MGSELENCKHADRRDIHTTEGGLTVCGVCCPYCQLKIEHDTADIRNAGSLDHYV